MRNGKLLLNLFILFHLTLILLWNLPQTATHKKIFERGAAHYMYWTGLDQNWGILAPAIALSNWQIKATITFRDGSAVSQELPRAKTFGPIGKTMYSRRIAWGYWIAYFKQAWPDAARHLARLHAKNPANPPVKVALIQDYAFILPPQKGKRFYPIPKEHAPTTSATLFTYDVKQEDL